MSETLYLLLLFIYMGLGQVKVDVIFYPNLSQSFGAKYFAYNGCFLWNKLPSSLWAINKLGYFKQSYFKRSSKRHFLNMILIIFTGFIVFSFFYANSDILKLIL